MFDSLALPANVAIFAASAMVVWLAGTRLARYADAIAEETGIGREFLGLLLLGGVTSLPEVAVAVTATLQGTPVLSVNDVLGSAAINLVILALADAVIGRAALTSMIATPGVILQGILGIVLLAVVVAPSITGDVLVAGLGAWSWIMLATYLGALWLIAKSAAGMAWKPALARRPKPKKGAHPEHVPLRSLAARTAAAGAAILAAGFLLATSGEAIAGQSGLGTSFFGAVFLAASTSLPEMSTVIAAVRLGRYEMAISDIFGTNLFNVAIIVLVDALHPGEPILVEAGRFASFGALVALVLTGLFLAGMIERRDRTVLRMGYDSLAALAIYAAGVAVLYNLR